MPVPAGFLAEQPEQLWLTVLCGQMSLAEVRSRDAARRQALAHPVTGRNQVWLLDFAHFYINEYGQDIWRITGVADYWSRYEFSWHVGPAWQPGSSEAAIAMAISEAENLEGAPLSERLRCDPATGEPVTVKVIARSALGFCDRPLARYVASFPELDLIRTWTNRVEPGPAGERGFEALKTERFSDGVASSGELLAATATAFRKPFNGRPHPGLAHHRPIDVHLGYAEGVPSPCPGRGDSPPEID